MFQVQVQDNLVKKSSLAYLSTLRKSPVVEEAANDEQKETVEVSKFELVPRLRIKGTPTYAIVGVGEDKFKIYTIENVVGEFPTMDAIQQKLPKGELLEQLCTRKDFGIVPYLEENEVEVRLGEDWIFYVKLNGFKSEIKTNPDLIDFNLGWIKNTIFAWIAKNFNPKSKS